MGDLFAFCPSLQNKCLTLSQQARTRMKQYSLEKYLDEPHLEEYGIAAKDRVPISFEARNLKYLYQTRRVGASIEENSKIQESVSNLFNALAQLTTCGLGIKVLEAMVVDEQPEEPDLNRAYRSDQEKDNKIKQEDMALVAKAEQLLEEQLLEEQVSVADLNQEGVRCILPFRHAGVWHCLFRSSEFICVISVTKSREMKVTGRLWYN
jgi:hypothetical protein